MAPGTHAFVSWWTANVVPLSRRDRLLILLAGILPDIDGIAYFFSTQLYVTYHHIIAHNLLGGILTAAGAAALADDRVRCPILVLLSWHLHLACDYFGSSGPGSTIWPLPYLFPLVGGWDSAGRFTGPAWYWNAWQWDLNAWPNLVVMFLSMIGWVYIAVRLDRTFCEFVWPRMDRELCKTLRRWCGGQPSDSWSASEGLLIRRSFVALTCGAVLGCVVAAAHS